MDKVLKQRLIGASILIALAVIFVPMLFDGPEPDSVSRELSIELPSAPGDRATVRRLPLDPDQARTTAQSARDDESTSSSTRIDPPRITPDIASESRSREDLAAAIESEAEEPEGQTRAEPVVEEAAASASETASASRACGGSVAASEPDPVAPEAIASSGPETAAPADSSDRSGFEVQVASFGSRQNADDLVDRLTRLGHVASIDLLVRGPSELHRVRTGPYSDRSDAERALSQIRQTIEGVDPVIVESSAADLPERPGRSGYAVQVGSFASRNNAVRLLDQLAGQGYDAFVHEDRAGSRTIWRVRVGPLGSRDEAVQRLARMSEDDGIDGLVVSHP